MKIAFITRSTLIKQPGGDTQQVTETASALSGLGVDAEVILSGQRADLSQYDLVHFFNLGRPGDLLRYSGWEKKPLFISTIWVDYGPKSNEYLKTIARGLIGNDHLPPLTYLLDGQEKSIGRLVDKADLLITTSAFEQQRLQNSFSGLPPLFCVPPGLNPDFLESLPEEKEPRHGVLCVGRFEEVKNQLTLIRALRDTDIQVTFVGNPATNNPAYYKQCQREAGPNMSFRPHASMNALQILYRSHRVVVVPSKYETFGLTALEGLSQKCQVVLSHNTGAMEYLSDVVFKIDPMDKSQMKDVVLNAYESPIIQGGKDLSKEYTWKSSAQKLVELYKARLGS